MPFQTFMLHVCVYKFQCYYLLPSVAFSSENARLQTSVSTQVHINEKHIIPSFNNVFLSLENIYVKCRKIPANFRNVERQLILELQINKLQNNYLGNYKCKGKQQLIKRLKSLFRNARNYMSDHI